MSKRTEIDTGFLNHMRSEINDALDVVGQANGMTIGIGSITYSTTGFKTRIEAELGNAEEGERTAFERATKHFFGEVTPDMYGMKFTNGRDTEEYTLVGLKPKSPKWPVMGRNTAGVTYKFKLGVISREKQTPRIKR